MGKAPAAVTSRTALSSDKEYLLLLTALFSVLIFAATASIAAKIDTRSAGYYEDALVRFDKKDFPGAIIQLKNALQQDPGMLAAYSLLGKAHLELSQPQPAQEAFERALKLGVHPSELALPIGQTLLAQGKARELLERFPPEAVPGAQRSELLVLHGYAYKQLGDYQAALRMFEEGRASDPTSNVALRSQAELLIQLGRPGEARRLADDAIKVDPSNGKAWFILGISSHAAEDLVSALTAYTRAAELDPLEYEARRARAALLLDLNRVGEAARDIAHLDLLDSKDPRSVYIRATYLSKTGEAKKAREALAEIAQILSPLSLEVLKVTAPQFLLIGALTHYQLQAPEQAKSYLDLYLQAEPSNLDARKLYASILLSQRNYSAAIDVLEQIRKKTSKDPEVLAMLGASFIGRERPEVAVKYLEQAMALGGPTPQVNAGLGVALLRTGQLDLGLDYLRRAFDNNPEVSQIGVALVVAYMRRGDTKHAIDVAERVVKKNPRDIAAQNLLGVTRVAAKDYKGGRKAYEAAIQSDQNFIPAQLNLGKLEILEGKTTAARDRYLTILKRRPKDVQVMLELAKVEDSVGKTAAALQWLEKLRAVNNRNIPGVIYLIDLYVRLGETKKAVDTAENMEAFAPTDLAVLAALGRAHISAGDEKLAQAVFARMAAYAGFDAGWQYEIGRYQLNANNPRGAAFSLEKALAAKPDFSAAEELFAEIQLRLGQVETAEAAAQAIVKKRPERAVGYRLLGDVASHRGRYQDAIVNYRAALGKESTTDAALRLHHAYVVAGTPAKATEFLQVWLRQNPRDFTAIRALADLELQAGNLEAARARYESVLREQGEDSNVLNNLANILSKRGGALALEYAKRAFQMAPGNPAIQDTLGWILVQEGQVEAGLDQLREARLRDPQNPEIRYHLAVALLKSGRQGEARQELDLALASAALFEGVDEARRLASQLKQ